MVVPAMKPAYDINLLARVKTRWNHDEHRAVVVMTLHGIQHIVVPVAIDPAGVGEGSVSRRYAKAVSGLGQSHCRRHDQQNKKQ